MVQTDKEWNRVGETQICLLEPISIQNISQDLLSFLPLQIWGLDWDENFSIISCWTPHVV